MPVVSMFDTSFCHIRMSDYHLLQHMARSLFHGEETPFRVHATEHTIVIHMVWAWPWGDDPDAWQRGWIEERLHEGFSRKFCELLLAASEHECRILQLDQDADEDDGFTIFDGDEVVERRPMSRLQRILTGSSVLKNARSEVTDARLEWGN
ncbi:MAG: hypothetical protein K5905_24200 [Roseibium sp.]|uniref:DUF5983 family protein n=1 Tax=Roseibium sp. TaxID=1936156 RepID=UPI002620440B|nr:hypothetical protein [Roseibium sp.]MCV0428571.1 hypothetical protein [Roseibium sp.]